MDTNDTNVAPGTIVYKDLSYKVVGLAMQAHNELGFGFLEKVYENALMVLFEENGIHALQQFPIPVRFHRLALLINFGKHRLEDERLVL